MMQLAAACLVASALPAAAAVGGFFRSSATAERLLLASMVAAAAGATLVAVADVGGYLPAWAFLPACASFGCGANAGRHLFAKRGRWVHRFVIYAGYGATFAATAALAVLLTPRPPSGRAAAAILIGAFVLGSVGVFLAKTFTLKRLARTMPDYLASIASGQNGAGYW